MDAIDVSDTLNSFAAIKSGCKSEKGYSAFRNFLFPSLTFRQGRLFECLDIKVKSTKPIVQDFNDEMIISGAGPCGLRAAVEASLLGYKVTVVELRSEFSRHNIIKTWRCTINDLMGLGLSHYYPAFQPHGHLHLGIRQIQMCLLKTALLLNVNVMYNTGVCGIVDASVTSDQLYHIWILPAIEARKHLKLAEQKDEALTLQPGNTNTEAMVKKNKVDYFEPANSINGAITDQNTQMSLPFHCLLIGEGESSKMIRNLGFDRKISKFGEALGIVINLDFCNNPAEKKLREYVISRSAADWRDGPLGTLFNLNIELENMEYMRGFNTHFFVVTVKKQTLINFGVIKSALPTIKECLQSENLDFNELKIFARHLATASNIPEECPFSQKHGVQIFDFSCKGVCVDQLRFLKCGNTQAPIFPIGDAIQNPFWPQGLGVNRGFQSTLDAVYAARLWSTTGDVELVKLERQLAWKVMDWKSFQEESLQTPDSKTLWNSDPFSRYSHALYKDIHLFEMSNGLLPSVPLRIRQVLNLK